jgi:hypothetical protein
MGSLSIEEMVKLADKIKEEDAKWDINSLDNWFNRGFPPEASQKLLKSEDYSPEKKSSKEEKIGYLSQLKLDKIKKEPSWQRIEILEGFEIHVRSDVYSSLEEFISRLIESLKRNLQ